MLISLRNVLQDKLPRFVYQNSPVFFQTGQSQSLAYRLSTTSCGAGLLIFKPVAHLLHSCRKHLRPDQIKSHGWLINKPPWPQNYAVVLRPILPLLK
jgi:hypothetical protein